MGACEPSGISAFLFAQVCNISRILRYAVDRLTNFRDNSEVAKPSKQEVRRAEAAAKRQKMLVEQQREKDKVKDRLDLIRQMKGEGVSRSSLRLVRDHWHLN